MAGVFVSLVSKRAAGVVLAALLASASHAQAQTPCASDPACASALAALSAAPKAPADEHALKAAGISITVDGETVAGIPRPQESVLDEVQVDIRFDGLDVERRLAVSTVPERRTFEPGLPVLFRANWNHGAWIERAEIRLYERATRDHPARQAAPVAVLPVDADGSAILGPEPDLPQDMTYVLRVYDAAGRYDETTPLALAFAGQAEALDIHPKSAAPGELEQRIAHAGIPLAGGKVIVHGRNVPPGHAVLVMGEPASVDAQGSFVAERVLPSGDHRVGVSVRPLSGAADAGLDFQREIHIPESEWFGVGIADLTIGRRVSGDSGLVSAAPGEYDSVWRKGRVAFYLKGKVRGSTIITAALDTREDELDRLFTNLGGRDPRQLLRQLDPDDFYPVYGDDSTTVDDAPTSGKMYVRVDHGRSHVMWGNFKARIDGAELTRFERGLYGANADLKTDAATGFGEPVARLRAFAAQPGTLPQRDEFRGTGGSVYFLRRQEITLGSEQVAIEERDSVTGLVVDRTLLRPGQDYDFDAMQGVVILKNPLASTAPSTSPVQDGTLGGNQYWLVATYEYTPVGFEEDGHSYGGRAEMWLSDHVRVGATGYMEDTGPADQFLYGADLVLRLSEKTYFEIEWAESDGDTFGIVKSTDGGFIFNPVPGAGNGGTAQAWRTKVVADLGEITGGAVEGRVGASFEEREAGFNAPGRYTQHDQRIWGAFAEIGDRDSAMFSARYDEASRGDGLDKREGSAEATARLNEAWSVGAGVTHSTITGSADEAGGRTDAGVRVTRHLSETDSVYAFGQATLARDAGRERNDRAGLGVESALTDKLTARIEGSWGTSGPGLLAGIEYEPTASDRYYLGYRLSPDTTMGDMQGYDPFGRDYGAVVLGSTRKLSDSLMVTQEENWDLLGRQQSLTHAFGVTFTPDPAWRIGASAEAGEIRDEVNGDFERLALSGSASYSTEAASAGLRLEGRFEDGLDDDARDRQTFLATANWSYKAAPEWRFLAKIDAAISRSDQSVILDGDYIEASVGYAYRPVDNDRVNALLRYSYLHDLPGAQQVNANNQLLGPLQRSHVASVDAIFGLNEMVSIGGKYGVRLGEVNWDRTGDDFEFSSAQLLAGRIDLHVVHQWDLMAEARLLWLSETGQADFGLLAGVYRHIGNNLKLGAGYNFGRFSDDLTDLVQDDRGFFVNVVGKF